MPETFTLSRMALYSLPAGAKDPQHRFHDITEDLTALVFFAPAEGSTSTSR